MSPPICDQTGPTGTQYTCLYYTQYLSPSYIHDIENLQVVRCSQFIDGNFVSGYSLGKCY